MEDFVDSPFCRIISFVIGEFGLKFSFCELENCQDVENGFLRIIRCLFCLIESIRF